MPHLTTYRRPMMLVLLAVTPIVLLAACGSSEDRGTRAPDAPPVPVVTVAAAIAELPESIEAGGVVTASATAVVTSRVVAPVAEVRVRAGDRVRADQVLVVLDAGALGAQAQQATAATAAVEQAVVAAKAEHAASMADQQLADAWHTRIAALHARKAATPQELDEAEARRSAAAARTAGTQARIEQAASQLAAARAAADAAETTRGFTVIRAPFAGLVTERMTDPGNLASPGVPLLRLDAAGAPRVEARVDEARAALVAPGDRAEVLLDAGGSPLEGVVLEVARAVDADQRAFTVKVSLPAGHAARTGSFARVRFDGRGRTALLVPAAAIRWQGQVATAFVVDDGVARLRLLQTGLISGDRAEVMAGLDPGEVVVVDPPPALVDGNRVTAESATAEGAGR
ncbi:MAG: efflux RND transporter periplasmic adaptor subunit [Vicinamibacterales bacterium]